ncbi:hypothetical protein ACOI1H_16335 [Loktanella sp. DJP18]|uniref:hypothetical protein n=1 Tax=Loktanella sp. DJP18 TaxID=3409788 RepID=UPI003BB7D08E
MEDFIAYHGLQGRRPKDFSFGCRKSHPEGIHLGTLPQARMRAGSGTVLKVLVRASALSQHRPVPRVKDRDDSWRNVVKRRAALGQQLLTYLNRHEGIPGERVMAMTALSKYKILTMPDRQFRKVAPEAEDSWIVLDPDLVRIIGPERKRR